jgi:hypothetical protein
MTESELVFAFETIGNKTVPIEFRIAAATALGVLSFLWAMPLCMVLLGAWSYLMVLTVCVALVYTFWFLMPDINLGMDVFSFRNLDRWRRVRRIRKAIHILDETPETLRNVFTNQELDLIRITAETFRDALFTEIPEKWPYGIPPRTYNARQIELTSDRAKRLSEELKMER